MFYIFLFLHKIATICKNVILAIQTSFINWPHVNFFRVLPALCPNIPPIRFWSVCHRNLFVAFHSFGADRIEIQAKPNPASGHKDGGREGGRGPNRWREINCVFLMFLFSSCTIFVRTSVWLPSQMIKENKK